MDRRPRAIRGALSARVRLLSAGGDRENDALDAVYAALAALRGERPAEVSQEDRASVPRMLSERREDLDRAVSLVA